MAHETSPHIEYNEKAPAAADQQTQNAVPPPPPSSSNLESPSDTQTHTPEATRESNVTTTTPRQGHLVQPTTQSATNGPSIENVSSPVNNSSNSNTGSQSNAILNTNTTSLTQHHIDLQSRDPSNNLGTDPELGQSSALPSNDVSDTQPDLNSSDFVRDLFVSKKQEQEDRIEPVSSSGFQLQSHNLANGGSNLRHRASRRQSNATSTYPSRASLLSLPPDIHLEILPFLEWPDARALRQACRTLRHLYPPRLVALLRPHYELSLLSTPDASTLPCYSCTRLKSRPQFLPSPSARLLPVPPHPASIMTPRARLHPPDPPPVLAITPGGVERPICRLCWRTCFGDRVARALEGRRPKGECARCKRRRLLVWGLPRVRIAGGIGVAAGEGGFCWVCSGRARASELMERAVESERFWAWLLGSVECGLAACAVWRMVRVRAEGRRERDGAVVGVDMPELAFAGFYGCYVLANLLFWMLGKFVNVEALRDVYGLRTWRRFVSRHAIDGAVIILNLFVALLCAVAVAIFTFFIRRLETIPLHGILSLLSLVAVPAAFARMLNHDD